MNKGNILLGFVLGLGFYEFLLIQKRKDGTKRPTGGGTGRPTNKTTLTDAQRFENEFYAGIGKTQNNYSNIF
jgi:hypothetical protein